MLTLIKTIKVLYGVIGAIFAPLPFCSLPGAVAGSFAGFLFGIFQLENPGMPLTLRQLIIIGALLGLTGLLLVLFFFGMLLRYDMGQILWPALLNALLTATLAVIVNNWLSISALAGLVGMFVGIVVGALLCRLCRFKEGVTYA